MKGPSGNKPSNINSQDMMSLPPRLGGFIIIGHRGCNGATSQYSSDGRDVPSHLLPENTLQALSVGMFDCSNGIQDLRDGNEFDAYVTKEGIPVVCHDDALNKNVAGANRSGTELGYISQSRLDEVFRHDVGQGRIIPPLEAVLIGLGVNNELRQAKGLTNIIFNIELKGAGTARAVYLVVQKVISQLRRIEPRDIIYCSSSFDELKQLRELDNNAQIAFAVNTEQFYGKDNVLDGFMVPKNLMYRQEFFLWLDYIGKTINFDAIDCTFWDINDDLVDYAIKYRLSIHTIITGNHGINTVTIDRLLDLHERLGKGSDGRSRLYFKTDYPQTVKTIMEERLVVRAVLRDMRYRSVEQRSDSSEVVPSSYIIKDSTEQVFNSEAVRWHMGAKGRFLRPGQMPEVAKQPMLVVREEALASRLEKKSRRFKTLPPGYSVLPVVHTAPLLFNPTHPLLDPRVSASLPPASYCATPDSYCATPKLNIDTPLSHFNDSSHLGAGHSSPSFGVNEALASCVEVSEDGRSVPISLPFSLPSASTSPHHRTIQTLRNALLGRDSPKAQNARLFNFIASPDSPNSKKAKLGDCNDDFADDLKGNSTPAATYSPSSTLLSPHLSQGGLHTKSAQTVLKPVPEVQMPTLPAQQLRSVNPLQNRQFDSPDNASLPGENLRTSNVVLARVQKNLLQNERFCSGGNNENAGAQPTESGIGNSQSTFRSRSCLKSIGVPEDLTSSPIFAQHSSQNSREFNTAVSMPDAAETLLLDTTRLNLNTNQANKRLNESASPKNAEGRSPVTFGF